MYYIVTDSSTDMPQSWVEAQHDFHIVSLSCTINGVSSVPGTSEVAKKETYRQLRSGVVIKTSAVNTATWEECFQKLLDEGQDVLCITFSSGLSGTYAAAADAAKELAPKYPNQKIIVIDSRCASAGEGLLVHYALQNREQGMSIEENAKWVKEHIQHLIHWFTVDDLMFLFRGGRVSKTAAWAGTLLNIKPVLHVDDEGHLIPMEKVRGRKKSLNALIDHMEKSANKPISDQMVFITHGDCIEDAEYVAAKIKERFGVKEVVINYVDPVIGAHSGPGTMALFFLADKR